MRNESRSNTCGTDAGLGLAGYDVGCRVKEGVLIVRLRPGILPRCGRVLQERWGPDQAADVGRQDAVVAVSHEVGVSSTSSVRILLL